MRLSEMCNPLTLLLLPGRLWRVLRSFIVFLNCRHMFTTLIYFSLSMSLFIYILYIYIYIYIYTLSVEPGIRWLYIPCCEVKPSPHKKRGILRMTKFNLTVTLLRSGKCCHKGDPKAPFSIAFKSIFAIESLDLRIFLQWVIKVFNN